MEHITVNSADLSQTPLPGGESLSLNGVALMRSQHIRNARIDFSEMEGAAFNNCTFTGCHIRIGATSNVHIEGCTFVGCQVEVFPGKLSSDKRWAVNELAFYNDYWMGTDIRERWRVNLRAKESDKIVGVSRPVKAITDLRNDYTKNRWMVGVKRKAYGELAPEVNIYAVACTKEERDTEQVQWQLELMDNALLPDEEKIDEMVWWTDNPSRYVRNIVVRKNTFIDSPVSGLNLYGVRGYIIEDNIFLGSYRDSAVTLEYTENGYVARNRGVSSQYGRGGITALYYTANVRFSQNPNSSSEWLPVIIDGRGGCIVHGISGKVSVRERNTPVFSPGWSNVGLDKVPWQDTHFPVVDDMG